MHVNPFDDRFAGDVASWPGSAEEAHMWCATKIYPVTPETVAGWQHETDVHAFVVLKDDTALGYGEIWSDDDEQEAELARIIVAPSARRQGVARTLVQTLSRKAQEMGFEQVFMRVHPDNHAAAACYRGVGYVDVDPELAARWNAVQPVPYLWLRLRGKVDG